LLDVSFEKSNTSILVKHVGFNLLITSTVDCSFSEFLAIKTRLNPFYANYIASSFPIPSVHPVTTAQDPTP
jgi:hypothetical protein